MVDLINKTMKESDEIWIRVHQKYDIYSIKTNNCCYLDIPDNGQLNWKNNECEWWSMNVSAWKIWNDLNCKFLFNGNKQLLLPHCYWQGYISSMKQLIWLMKYECECIKTTEWIKPCNNCIKWKQKKRTYLAVSESVWLNRLNNEW